MIEGGQIQGVKEGPKREVVGDEGMVKGGAAESSLVCDREIKGHAAVVNGVIH